MRGVGRTTTEAARAKPPDISHLRERVIEQSPQIFVTLVSILIGLDLSDLVSQARERMHLWPLDFLALRTWAQLISNGTAAVSVWMVLTHLGVTRGRVPKMSDTLSTFGPPLLILSDTTFVGQKDLWPWLYGAAIYLVTCIVSVAILVRHTPLFGSMLRPFGPMAVIYFGAPAYLVSGWLDQQGMLPPVLQVAVAFGAVPMTFIVCGMFFSEWRAALDARSPDA